jgi:hypothetical protein
MTDPTSTVETKLDSVLLQLANLQQTQVEIVSRVQGLERIVNSQERNLESDRDFDHTYSAGIAVGPEVIADDIEVRSDPLRRRSSHSHNSASRRTRAVRNLTETDTAGAVSQQQDIQEEFRAIKDALQKIKLPADIKGDDSKQGIKRQELSKAHIITKCSQYCETIFKLLLTLEPGKVLSQEDLDDLYTIVVANIRYLQEERGLVLVNSSLGPGVGGIYRNFRRNTTVFPPEALDALTAAVTLHSSNSSSNTHNQSNRYRGGFRGGYRGFRGNSNYNSYNGGANRSQQLFNRVQGNPQQEQHDN